MRPYGDAHGARFWGARVPSMRHSMDGEDNIVGSCWAMLMQKRTSPVSTVPQVCSLRPEWSAALLWSWMITARISNCLQYAIRIRIFGYAVDSI
jgi:hypothetical protein